MQSSATGIRSQEPIDGWSDKASALAGLLAIAALIVVAAVEPLPDDNEQAAARTAAGAGPVWRRHLFDPARAVGGYGGVSYTHPATVRINKKDGEITARDFGWIGRPFTSPIYYGARVWRWNQVGPLGHMIDFTHAKAIAKPGDIARFTGRHKGEELPKSAPMRDVFSKLEFSHGHNMLTYNGLLRLGALFGWLKPYAGAGAGISLPHTEIGFAKDNTRTYEYQFAGFVGQALVGVEIDLGRTSLFLEYKFTYAPYDVPLSHEPEGAILPIDLWRQFSAWWQAEPPPGGRLTVNLASHHGIAGVMVKTGPKGSYAAP